MWKRPNLLYPRNDSRAERELILTGSLLLFVWSLMTFYCKQICGAVSVRNTCPLQGALPHQHSLKPTAGTDLCTKHRPVSVTCDSFCLYIIPNLILFIQFSKAVKCLVLCVWLITSSGAFFEYSFWYDTNGTHADTTSHKEASDICFVDTLS